jgi:hypothetical protein
MFNAAFIFAVHGNPPGAEASAHLLLELTWVAVGVLALAELVRPAAGLHWFRAGAMIVVGTWLLTISWILFVSGWNLADAMSVSWTNVAFAWNVMGVAALVLVLRLALASRAPLAEAP